MSVTIVGGSIAGLSAALFLARAGRTVTILEADETPTPDAMGPADLWFRSGTPHGAQAHNFISGFVQEFRRRAPEVIDALFAGGAIHRRPEDVMPLSLTDRELRPGDEQLELINARRPFVEWTLRRFVFAEPNVTWRPGVRVRGVDAVERAGIPHVTAVVTESGKRIASEAVIDATGRRTRIEAWLGEIGARPSRISAHPCEQLYFTRYYLLRPDAVPPRPNMGFVVVNPLPFGAALVFPGDQGVIQCAIGCLPDDEPMKSVRDPARFHSFVSQLPATKPWLELADPISEVAVMANLQNHLRRTVSEGRPHVTGLFPTGDAWLTTNPQFGRGVAHAVMDAGAIADALCATEDPLEQALRVDAEADRILEPSFRDSAMNDRLRTVAWRAGLEDRAPVFSPELRPAAELQQRALVASQQDPEFWRVSGRCSMLLDPPGAWRDDPAWRERIHSIELPEPPASDAAGTRDRLLALLDG